MKLQLRSLIFFLFVLPQTIHIAFAQTESPKSLTLSDIYEKGVYRDKGIASVRWMKDNDAYSSLEKNEITGGVDLVKYDAKTGKRSVLVSAKQMMPEGSLAPVEISDYQWSEDNSSLLIFTNTRKVWRYHTRGDYWVLDLKTNKLTQLGQPLQRANMMFAKFSPDASKVAYVYKNNIYVEDIATNAINQLTTDGNERFINGTFDWVYEEEFDCRDGFRWSPDGESIAFWHSDTEGTGTFYIIDNVDSIYSKVIPFPYPKVGTTNSAVKIGVIPSSGGETKWFDFPGDPRNNYLPRMEYVPHSSTLMVQQMNRLQNTDWVWLADTKSMEITRIMTERDEAFLDIHDNIMWMDHEKYFTWTSEKDGWRHLYQVSFDGTDERLITKGEFDVVEICRIDPKGGHVYYIASPDNPTERYLYRSRIDGKGEAERVTPQTFQGQNNYLISADARWAIHTYENVSTPKQYELISLPNHKTIRMLEDNREAAEKWNALSLNPKEFITVDIGEVVLDAWMIKPPGFDPAKKYPVIFYVYGEPAGSTVQNNWSGGDLWHQYLAQQGYVVMSIDPRGTKTPRGRAWRKSIYEKIGIVATADHAAAVTKIIETYPFVDSDRVGIWGWSGGGQMTLNCMFHYPEIYKTGIAIAFVSDQRLYNTIYQERYMGLPSENVTGYHDGSPINFANNLEGELLIIHGTADDNVHYQSFEMLIDELIRNNKMFSMMSYPMRSHGIWERENTTYHMRQLMAQFWIDNLAPGAK